jgi:OmpA family/Putative peptidoglycan binding domain
LRREFVFGLTQSVPLRIIPCVSDPAVDPSNAPADGSTAGTHPESTKQPLLVGPATADQKNTVRPDLIPVACWKLEDIKFDFDSSFVRADAAPDFASLRTLLKKHQNSPLSVFGHADPVGTDAYNKSLSGRRAISVYGVLTRNADMWEHLWAGNGETWGNPQVLAMLTALSYAPGQDDGLNNNQASDALKRFQSDNGLTPHGYINAATRKKLFLAYMDVLCGKAFVLKKTDFLAQGASADGRGDYQGCGEFNPLLLFSQADLDTYSKPGNEIARNAANASNRRVMIFLFPKGSKVTPDLWPCPKADTKDFSACEKRFWSDGRQRLKNTEKQRTFDVDHNTFACRFYERMCSLKSPCERTHEQWVLRILVAGKTPLEGRKALANEPYTLSGTGSGTDIKGRTDQNGVLRAPVEDDVCTMTLTIAGMKIIVDGGALQAAASGDPAWKERLANLGFGDGDPDAWDDPTYQGALSAFQKLEKLTETGAADSDTTDRIKSIHGS